MEFNIMDRYRLELHWKKVRYDVDQTAILEGCYFNGPVLKDILQLNQKDFINLDFTNQYIIFANIYYIARLSWEGVQHTTDKIILNNVILENKNLNVVPKLNANDYIVIDTRGHEDEKHLYNLVYPACLMHKDAEFYNFRSMK
jgi:hypothetical protein